HQYLAELVTQSIPVVAIEVSSHGLDQRRVAGVTFEVALFTHISRDHLDYHGTLEEYAAAKARLFSENDCRHAVIGRDDAFSELMLNACPDHVPVTTWSLSDTSADVFARHLQAHSQGFTAEIHTPWGIDQLETALLGRFNLENLLAVIAVLGVQGYPLNKILEAIQDLTTPPGRMQPFGGGSQPLVLVDYAHTPDAIKSVLSALREHGARRLVCVYGCGGDRDPGKRPLMTAAALGGADRVVLTSDNPRTEDPQKIIGDALEGVSEQDRNRLEVVVDRHDAITGVIARCEPGDIVVVAGKGHENYQEIHGVRHHFDDREQVQGALALREGQ
ncbi:MAG: Mur ligase family protein, partial [Endozoicomonas sp.]